MRMPCRLLALASAATLCAGLAVNATAAPAAPAAKPGDDAVVIAVIDSGMSPYHWDFLASRMPQAKTPTKADDLPLDRAPHTWLRGFPKPSAFSTYKPLNLTLAERSNVTHASLRERDDDAWLSIEASSADGVAYRWVPGTKVIGAIAFGAGSTPVYGSGPGEHGMGTASAAVGNIYGSCPECLLVFIQANSQGDYETAIEWAENQPWIDAISNSYGMSTTPVARDRVYAGSDTELQKAATERGQTVFFSAGNGVFNDFVTPNGTLLSSQEGPDWIVTVGATDPAHVDYPGSGRPADIAAIGSLYPAAYGGTTISGSGKFGGTSNATPVIAGTYGRALWRARQLLTGPSRIQAGGVIANGGKVACGAARRDCELGDGVLTRAELWTRLFEGAKPTQGGFAGRRTIPGALFNIVPVPAPIGGSPVPFVTTPPVADMRWLSEGHGTYRAKINGAKYWNEEFDSRLWLVMTGARPAPDRPAGDEGWFRVDSWCRQKIWGAWEGGFYTSPTETPLPLPDPVNWPSRTSIQASCNGLTRPQAP